MAPKYKLIYFNARARMEVTRLALEYSGIPYEDHRIAQEDWPAIKAMEPNCETYLNRAANSTPPHPPHVAPGPYHADGPGTRLYIPFGRLSSTHVERKMATPKYKLIYFDGRGRMEVIRLALEYSGIPYEDQRLAKPDWLAIKASGRFPFNQLPILEVDGKIILAQSISILRYVSKEAGLYPTDPLEAAKVDMIIDGLSDVRPHLRDIFFESDPAKKEELRKKAYEEVLPVQLAFFEKLLESNDGGNGYFVGSKMTCADLHFFAMMNNWLSYGKLEVPEPIQGFPLLSGLFSRVMNDPKIMAWLKKRPQTPL